MAVEEDTEGRFDVRGALTWLGLILLAVVTIGVLWFGGKVLLLAFASILLAVVLRAPTGVLVRRTGMPDRVAFALVLLLLLLSFAGFGLIVGPQVLTQAGEFTDRVPQIFEDARSYLGSRPWGRWLVDRISGGGSDGVGGGAVSAVAPSLGGATRSITTTGAHLALVGVLAIFLAANPTMYRRGLVRLFPASQQQRAAEVVDELGRTLKAWMVGQLALMLITGVLTGIGLVIVGVPLALALAFFVGLMEFIPFIGPILGFIPIVMMAATQGGSALLWVLILYLGVQQLEGNLLTPLIQQQAVALPPALTIAGVFLGGSLFGLLGAILGTPLVAVIFVLVKMLYLHDSLGQQVEVPGKTESA
ncbi:MAG: AI-2E family transporter [Trueperaceae bacterium]